MGSIKAIKIILFPVYRQVIGILRFVLRCFFGLACHIAQKQETNIRRSFCFKKLDYLKIQFLTYSLASHLMPMPCHHIPETTAYFIQYIPLLQNITPAS